MEVQFLGSLQGVLLNVILCKSLSIYDNSSLLIERKTVRDF